MTRKAYREIAEELKSVRPEIIPDIHQKVKDEYNHRLFQWKNDVHVIADCLKRDNPSFDYNKFYEACNYNGV